MRRKDLIKYWVESSDSDLQAMVHLYEQGDYAWALFIGHLVIEKLLKAWYVRNVNHTPPFTHDLVRLAAKGVLSIDEKQKDLLDTISTFNLRTRYDDYKREFHKKCTPEFTSKWVAIIKELREWIKNRLMK